MSPCMTKKRKKTPMASHTNVSLETGFHSTIPAPDAIRIVGVPPACEPTIPLHRQDYTSKTLHRPQVDNTAVCKQKNKTPARQHFFCIPMPYLLCVSNAPATPIPAIIYCCLLACSFNRSLNSPLATGARFSRASHAAVSQPPSKPSASP